MSIETRGLAKSYDGARSAAVAGVDDLVGEVVLGEGGEGHLGVVGAVFDEEDAFKRIGHGRVGLK